VRSGYRHFYLHPRMRDYFLFHYGGRIYSCIALPFGWGRSGLWFMKLMRPVVKHPRSELGYRVLPWINDFVCAPTDGRRPATGSDCWKAGSRPDAIFGGLGLTRHPDKGCWGSQILEHLGFLIDTRQMRVFVTDSKVQRMRRLAQEILLSAQRNQRLVVVGKLRHFCGVAVSLTLALPMARFYTWSLYWDMRLAGLRAEDRGQSQREVRRAERGGRRAIPLFALASARQSAKRSCHTLSAPEQPLIKIRLLRQSLRDLAYWCVLLRGEGWDLHSLPADLTMHSDAAEMGYGGTLGTDPGSTCLWEGRSLWAGEERAEAISRRELNAVRLLLKRHFASYLAQAETRRILLHEDNQAVVHILNAMVSASRPMMAEIRRLEVMMRALGVRMEETWLPSAFNRYADSLSRQWDPGDVRVTEELVQSLSNSYAPGAIIFSHRPVGEHPIARRKHLQT
jgi:hypothetical protein